VKAILDSFGDDRGMGLPGCGLKIWASLTAGLFTVSSAKYAAAIPEALK